MLRPIIFCFFICYIFANEDEPDMKYVTLEEGTLAGEKYWDGEFYEFYGVPYATAPKGRDRFKGPLPVEPWQGVYPAKQNRIVCHQTFYTGEDPDEIYLAGEEDCLVMNLLVPKVASETNLVPVVVYIHSGAFSAGNGNMAKYNYLARHDVLVISFNFRLGAVGFACLGNEDIPGNAGMKDQVAALRWINKNIRKFGGDPKKITVAGFSVGAAMAELLTLSKSTAGLVDKLILESGSALSPYSINRDPISTAKNIAISMGYNGTGDLRDLTEFYFDASNEILAARSLNFFLTNSTFGFAPCIENMHDNIEPFLTESPLDIMNRSDYHKVSVLTGFANMEGISRALKFDKWSEMMNENFFDFLPADLNFDSDKSKDEVINKIKDYYFKGEEVTHDTLQGYIDYFSDSMFKYSIMKSAKLHAAKSKRPVYFYEFAYVGTLSMKHNYMDKVKGASHRDQSSYILDFFSFTNNYGDLDIRDRMTLMWSDFVKYEDPTAVESSLVTYKWLTYSEKEPNYLLIDLKSEMKRDLLTDGYQFWNKIYEKYYWTPKAPKVENSVTEVDETKLNTDAPKEEEIKTKTVTPNVEEANKQAPPKVEDTKSKSNLETPKEEEIKPKTAPNVAESKKPAPPKPEKTKLNTESPKVEESKLKPETSKVEDAKVKSAAPESTVKEKGNAQKVKEAK